MNFKLIGTIIGGTLAVAGGVVFGRKSTREKVVGTVSGAASSTKKWFGGIKTSAVETTTKALSSLAFWKKKEKAKTFSVEDMNTIVEQLDLERDAVIRLTSEKKADGVKYQTLSEKFAKLEGDWNGVVKKMDLLEKDNKIAAEEMIRFGNIVSAFETTITDLEKELTGEQKLHKETKILLVASQKALKAAEKTAA